MQDVVTDSKQTLEKDHSSSHANNKRSRSATQGNRTHLVLLSWTNEYMI